MIKHPPQSLKKETRAITSLQNIFFLYETYACGTVRLLVYGRQLVEAWPSGMFLLCYCCTIHLSKVTSVSRVVSLTEVAVRVRMNEKHTISNCKLPDDVDVTHLYSTRMMYGCIGI